ncbi:hypothetical protein [Caulobacter sp. 1776]|uniref:hypothetical protein n=1 Tax=Caulobacter sp. 1776 TaxID=3156420 RepID=UPI003391EE87
MLLSALTFAALLQAASLVEVPPAPLVQLPPPAAAKETRGSKQLAAWQARTLRMMSCNRFGMQHAQGAPAEAPGSVDALARRSSEKAKKLGEMPAAHGERAVLRVVDGCPVATPIVQVRPTF